MRPTKIAASGSGGCVVRLPTAPKNRVRQNYTRAARAAKADLPKFPGEYIHPGIRDAMPTAGMLLEMRKAISPEMELLTAICAALDETMCAKVAEALAPGVAVGRPTAVQAMAVFRTTRMSARDFIDLDNAMRRLGGY
jgi:hypothetical protein